MATCLISIGSNLGDPVSQVTTCVDILRQNRLLEVSAVSKLRKTKPVGGPLGQEAFTNAAVRIETRLSPQDLLSVLQQIENGLGRVRDVRWGPRVIDLDLLLYDDLILRTEDLELPHPRMAFRRFVVEPASEIAGEMLHPLIGWTVSQIAAHLGTAPDYIALTGIPGTGKTAIVQAVSDRIQVNLLLSDFAPPGFLKRDAVAIAAEETGIMDRRKEMLSTISAVQPRGVAFHDRPKFSLSDFWFEQSAVYVDCFLEGEIQAELTVKLEEAIEIVPKPKLLVVLERSLGSDDPNVSGDSCDDRLKNLQQRIVDRSRLPQRGPTLWLDAEDSNLAVDEIVAAIEAMQ